MAAASEPQDQFEYGSHTFQGKTLPYRFFKPEGYQEDKLYPLILALHGIDDRGDDNEIQLLGNRLAFSWSDSINQQKWPCFILVPQCPGGERWYEPNEDGIYDIENTIMDLIDSLISVLPVDTNHLYLTGLSLGGYGVWHLIERFPHKFAVAVPVCGGGNNSTVSRFNHLPIWAFHGEKDDVVPVTASRKMIEAMERSGRECVYTHCKQGDCTGMTEDEIQAAINAGADLLYTEWPDLKHDVWDQSYDYLFLFPWVFSQSKEQDATWIINSHQVGDKLSFKLLRNHPNPFNPETIITLKVSHIGQDVKLVIYDALGKKIKTLFNGPLLQTQIMIAWDGRDESRLVVPSGIYYANLKTGKITHSLKMTFIK